MIIKKIHISSFGTLRERDFELSPGLNVVLGANESGKTSLAMFIKFVFYGLSSRSSGSSVSERKKYVNWDTGTASGTLELSCSRGDYVIERKITVSGVEGERETYRESVKIIDLSSGVQVFRGSSPAEVFLSVPEEVFVSTVFISQSQGAVPDGGGMMTALENILQSGDENVNTEKAQAKLDEARRALLYKNENGGLIYEHRNELSSARRELEAAKECATETIEAELSYSEASRKLAELEEKSASLTSLCSAYDAIYTKRVLDASSAAERRIAELKNKIASLEASPAGGVAIAEEFAACEREYIRRRENVERLEGEIASFGDEWETDPSDEIIAEGVYLELEKTVAAGRRYLGTSGVFFFFAVLLAVGAVSLLTMNSVPYLFEIALAAGVLFFGVGIILLVAHGRAKRRTLEILSEWGVEDEGELSAAIKAKNEELTDRRSRIDEQKRVKDRLDAENELFSSSRRELEAIGERMGIRGEQDGVPLETLCAELIKKNSALRETLRRESDTYSGRLAAMREQIGSPDREEAERAYSEAMATPDGKRAEGLDGAGIAAYKRERDFTLGVLRSQAQRTSELEKKLIMLRANNPSPSGCAARVAELEEKIKDETLRWEAYRLAIDTVSAAAENVRATMIPKITESAAAVLSRASGGKYEKLGLSPTFEMSYTREGSTRSVDYLSGGTRELAYISLRLAMLPVLFGDDHPMAVFDESFAGLDSERSRRLLEMLSADGAPQSLITVIDRMAYHVPEDANILKLS